MEEESWRRNHGGDIVDEESWRRNHGGDIIDEESWRRHLEEASGGGIIGSPGTSLGTLWGFLEAGVALGRSGHKKCFLYCKTQLK